MVHFLPRGVYTCTYSSYMCTVCIYKCWLHNEVTSCCNTDSDSRRLHRCCHLANQDEAENIICTPDIPYTLQWPGDVSEKLPLWLEEPGPHLHRPNTWFLGPTRVHTPYGTTIGSSISVGLTVNCDQQTYRPRYICNKPHLCTTCVQCGLIM